MSTDTLESCTDCNKSSFSLLLLRPSPIAKSIESGLIPLGARKVATEKSLIAGLLPERQPTESRAVLRLLREGYVHIYIPKPPKGFKSQWLIYRVMHNGDIIPESNPLFKQNPYIPCSRKEHNSAGMRLLEIPNAYLLTEQTLWIAYSGNLWNENLRTKNAADKDVMQPFVIGGKDANTFQPTEKLLNKYVLECKVSVLNINGRLEHQFPFCGLVKETKALAENLRRAAASHQYTTGKETALVLRDLVGFAAELNALRERRHELATQEIEKPENTHPLNSSNAVLGLKQSLLDAALAESFEKVSPLKTRAAYEKSGYPSGTEWRALSPAERQVLVKASSGDGWFDNVLLGPYKRTFETADLGRIVYPDHDARAEDWAKQQTEATWSKMASRYDEAARADWVDKFETRMKTEHYDPLALFEADWRAAAKAAEKDYFPRHYDQSEANSPLRVPSSGEIYAKENNLINEPAPITKGKLQEEFLAMLDKPIADKEAVALRALVGNQETLFDKAQAFLDELCQQASGDPGGAGMRDKTYDFVKGLRSESAVLKKYSWIGDALSAFSLGQLSALTAAALSIASDNKVIAPKLAKTLTKLQGLWGVQQAIELAVQGAIAKQSPKVPIIVAMYVSVDEAFEILRAKDPNISKNEVRRMRRGGKVLLSVLTDTDVFSASTGNNAIARGVNNGTVIAGPAAAGTVGAAGTTAVLSKEQFLDLYARQSRFGAQGAGAVREMMIKGSADIRAMTLTLDGRLAIGSVIVQGIGLVNGIGALKDAKTRKEIRDAWYGIYDSTAGVMGGLLELWAVAVNSRVLAQGGAQAAARGLPLRADNIYNPSVSSGPSLPLAALRFAANLAGAAGGAVNAAAAFAKAEDAKAAGNKGVANLLTASGYAFFGTSATSTMVGVGVAADWVVARQVSSVTVQRAASVVAVRLGAQGTAAFLGLSVSGWGLVLLGAGVLFQVGAMVLTPTPVQKWIGRSYFGKDDDKFPAGNWKAEQAGLLEAIHGGTETARKSEAKSVKKEALL